MATSAPTSPAPSVPASRADHWQELPEVVRSAAGESAWRLLNPVALAAELWRHRDLIRQFTVRETASKHRGSQLGLLWSVLNPLLVIAVYTFVFGVILNQRWNVLGGLPAEFPLTMLAGVTVFTVFADVVSAAPGMVVSRPNYVTKVVFPLEILPIAALGSALFYALVNLVLIVLGSVVLLHNFSATMYWFPLVLLPLVCMTLGVSWFLASLGVFLRDIQNIVALVVGRVMMLLTPLFFPISSVPEMYRGWIEMNPMTPIVENARRTLLWGQEPDWVSLGWVTLASVVVMQLGYVWFMKSKRGFADVV